MSIEAGDLVAVVEIGHCGEAETLGTVFTVSSVRVMSCSVCARCLRVFEDISVAYRVDGVFWPTSRLQKLRGPTVQQRQDTYKEIERCIE